MKQTLQAMIKELNTNPGIIKQIEIECDRLVQSDCYDTLLALCESESTMQFYGLSIIANKLKFLKKNGQSVAEIIQFMETVQDRFKTTVLKKKYARIFATLGLFEWPTNFPTFFNLIIELMTKNEILGYFVLECFFYELRNSLEIDEARRNELIRAMILVNNVISEIVVRDIFPEETIMIYTHLVAIIPTPVLNLEVVFNRGISYPEKTVSFFEEAIHSKIVDDVFVTRMAEFSTKIPVSTKMIECFIGLKNRICVGNLKMYEYVFNGLSTPSSAISSICFFKFLFRNTNEKTHDLSKIASAVMNSVLCVVGNDEYDFDDSEQEVFSVFSAISGNFPSAAKLLINEKAHLFPKNYTSFIVRSLKNRDGLSPQSFYLHAYLLYLSNSPECVNYLPRLNYMEKEDCRLAGQIVYKFKADNDFLTALVPVLNDSSYADEVIVAISMKTGTVGNLFYGNSMDVRTARRLYYLLRNRSVDDKLVSEVISSFYNFVLSNPYFERQFSVLGAIYKRTQAVPSEIFEKIYSEVDKYHLVELEALLSELVSKIDKQLQIPFLEKTFFRIIAEWKEINDEKLLVNATKAHMMCLEEFILKGSDVQYGNLYIEFMQTSCPIIFRRIYNFYFRAPFLFDTGRMIFYLLSNYNNSEMVETHSEIIGLLIECIKREDGPDAFAKLDLPVDKCVNIRELLLTNSIKRARTNIKNMLIEIKAKPLAQMYQNRVKVQSQNIFKKNTK